MRMLPPAAMSTAVARGAPRTSAPERDSPRLTCERETARHVGDAHGLQMGGTTRSDGEVAEEQLGERMRPNVKKGGMVGGENGAKHKEREPYEHRTSIVLSAARASRADGDSPTDRTIQLPLTNHGHPENNPPRITNRRVGPLLELTRPRPQRVTKITRTSYCSCHCSVTERSAELSRVAPSSQE